MARTQQGETTDYARLLGVFAAFDPQAVDTTPSIATPWDEPEPRIKLARRVAFIFTRDGRIGAYMALKGESVTLQPIGSSTASSVSGYQTLRGVLAGFSEQDVRNEPNAAGGPRIILSSRATFCFLPDGSIRLYSDLANDKNVFVRPRVAAPVAAQSLLQTAPAPAEKAAPERLRVSYPSQDQQRDRTQQQSTAAAPWPHERKTSGS